MPLFQFGIAVLISKELNIRSMKQFISIVLILLLAESLQAQNNIQRKWYVPDHVKGQFAGNIGFLSIGAGYLHGNQHLETDIYLGYLPESIGGDHIISMSAKMTYSPWKIPIQQDWAVVPFSVGPYLSYSFGSQFDTILPDIYPDGYYWWATSLRFGIFAGGRMSKATPHLNKISGIEFYYEVGTYDLEFLSYIQNTDYLGVTDIISLSLGVKVGF